MWEKLFYVSQLFEKQSIDSMSIGSNRCAVEGIQPAIARTGYSPLYSYASVKLDVSELFEKQSIDSMSIGSNRCAVEGIQPAIARTGYSPLYSYASVKLDGGWRRIQAANSKKHNCFDLSKPLVDYFYYLSLVKFYDEASSEETIPGAFPFQPNLEDDSPPRNQTGLTFWLASLSLYTKVVCTANEARSQNTQYKIQTTSMRRMLFSAERFVNFVWLPQEANYSAKLIDVVPAWEKWFSST
ncbi:hypothetical protein T265_04337 [Opisthorchis viverrini]|uniref:Uncharacterized protein n=1 Tax=Opisthorchis viverrini TaxID=6198 RepID=A0A075AGQ5_OPIVI|nr:hypothetical protein T265_04337 [Opisthorchis viverrini]KER28959.1 hypothetical protein T265_04337 [Opisthorchis viverrini]